MDPHGPPIIAHPMLMVKQLNGDDHKYEQEEEQYDEEEEGGSLTMGWMRTNQVQ
jgi:hypothetical protein